ncbi:MAG: hypothetical protein LCH61_13555 [Proteobacteria bacterium]|nr:hypothetical protein [Pseudomonadota bacterium]
MLDTKFIAENTPRSPMPAMIDLLKGAPDTENVRVLIVRRLATAVHTGDSEEVFYWAIIHHGVFGGKVDGQVHLELLNAMKAASDGGH